MSFKNLIRGLFCLGAMWTLGCGGSNDNDNGDNGSYANAGTIEQAVTSRICPAGSTVEGIDVSIYQGHVDWNAVKGSGRAFGIARISDGLNYIDSQFDANWSGMKAAGLIRGAYQYFEPGQDAIAQANMVISKVGRLGPGDLPVMLDVEKAGGVSASGITAQVHKWIDAVTAGTGKTPLIYTGAYFWDDYVKSSDFAAHPLVIAWYGTNCPGVPNGWASRGWTFHQYTSSASVPGISGNVDADVFNGTLAQLQALAGGGSSGSNSGNSGTSSACGVRSDGKLSCANASGAALYSNRSTASSVVNHLRTTTSWFQCWGYGDLHRGGNHTWYYTLGDDNGNWGWVPAADLNTSSSFDSNPSANGLARCNAATPTSGCSVATDGRLYCGNKGGAALYRSANSSSGVANYLRSTFSWFSCWDYGAYHAGGNSTWYYTLGDDNGNWGWIPAVNMSTTSAFDSNPSSQGLRRCGK